MDQSVSWHMLSDMKRDTVKLPSQVSMARVIGKDRVKIKDIEKVSGSSLEIVPEIMEVVIKGPTEEAVVLFRRLILKCVRHEIAANKSVRSQAVVKDAIRCDFIMAAYYTLRN